MKLQGLRELFVNELRELYSAETQLTSALPKMAKASSSRALRAAFKDHLSETEDHIERLERIFDEIGVSPSGKESEALESLVRQGELIVAEASDRDARDAGLIAAAQKVEHYEIAGYGTVRTYAELLGERRWASLLQATLKEEKRADEKLNAISTKANVKARQKGAGVRALEEEEDGSSIAGLVLGITLGAVAGVLFAPMAGTELRNRAREMTNTVRERASQVSETFVNRQAGD
jgi:ferritin-like metal-binding protein YciE